MTTRDYVTGMKTAKTPKAVTKKPESPSSVVRETPQSVDLGTNVSVRTAKAHLSALLDQVAAGREIVITSDGVPKARLVPMNRAGERKVFLGSTEHLKKMPPWKGGPTADEIVRADRDSRGW